ncbi:Zinc finger protein [Pseudolycoriella hygida]|uniref:Zinc finger protein n=1 Tax=Pseudolycoriella hygida TaxID=35572 RepID=A0A9Q0NGL2_9DIPT|nr:Zinc finger protein [Pseudolycoriella hygida]
MLTLSVHKLIHVGEKKHLCNYCGKSTTASFLSKGQLKVHERSHTLEKPFRCDVCDKAFSYRESLVTHSSLHTGIKPYLCEGCGSRFSCIGNLIKHRKSRPKTCGLPQFCKNTKIAPRASSKGKSYTILIWSVLTLSLVPGSLTMKTTPKAPRQKNKTKRNDTTVEIIPTSVSVIRNTNLEPTEVEILTPAIVDGEHFIIDDNITVESNIEIEFITSDELVTSEMEARAIEYDNSDKNENEFVSEMSSQQEDQDGGSESWENETFVKSDKTEHDIVYMESELEEPNMKNFVIQAGNTNDIIVENEQFTETFFDNIPGKPETEDEQYNKINEP